jgi:cytoskeleton protein RodZ
VDNRSMTNGIGQRLTEARAARGLELEQVTEQTKIRARYLRALEHESWDELPGAAYARAFLHTYAEFLGLDADAIVDEYRSREEPREDELEQPQVRQIDLAGRPPGRVPRRAGRPRSAPAGLGRWAVVGGVGAAALALIVVLALIGGDGDEEPAHGGAKAGRQKSAGGGESKPGAEAQARSPSQVALRLTATGTVWVCVVDQDDQPVVEGVTVPAGEELGPFKGREFDVGLGNGQVEIEANDEPVPVPDAAEPLGYRVTPSGATELGPAQRPTCT